MWAPLNLFNCSAVTGGTGLSGSSQTRPLSFVYRACPLLFFFFFQRISSLFLLHLICYSLQSAYVFSVFFVRLKMCVVCGQTVYIIYNLPPPSFAIKREQYSSIISNSPPCSLSVHQNQCGHLHNSPSFFFYLDSRRSQVQGIKLLRN